MCIYMLRSRDMLRAEIVSFVCGGTTTTRWIGVLQMLRERQASLHQSAPQTATATERTPLKPHEQRKQQLADCARCCAETSSSEDDDVLVFSEHNAKCVVVVGHGAGVNMLRRLPYTLSATSHSFATVALAQVLPSRLHRRVKLSRILDDVPDVQPTESVRTLQYHFVTRRPPLTVEVS